MKKIISVLHPFELKKYVLVYENENKIDSQEMTIDEFPEQIIALAAKYEITQIDLIGPHQYVRGICKQIQKEEMTKYSTNKLEINII